MNCRPYNPKTDRKAVQRIWVETGWIDADEKSDEKSFDAFLASSNTLVAEINGEAECLVTTAPGSIMHLETEVSLDIVASVTTSMIARRQGFASRLTATLIAQGAEKGLETASLGMFEQGFYSRLGFGTGPYEHLVSFDPARIQVNGKAGIPCRLTVKDYKECHYALMNRWRSHGCVQVFPAKHFKAEMGWTEDGLGLGYRNKSGELTHFVWGESQGEHGPYKIYAMAYQNQEQLTELLAMLQGLGDQLYSANIREPAHLQFQDILSTPFREQERTHGNEHQEQVVAEAFWQLRINDLVSCIAKTHLPGRATLSFNLNITDPITSYLEPEQNWQGIAGEYTIHLGENSEAKKGHSKGLPLLNATVGTFSRLWLGSASAHALAIAGDFQASTQLLDHLSQTLSLPLPRVGWDY